MFIKNRWTVDADYQHTKVGKLFNTLEKTLHFTGGKLITQDSESKMRKVNIDGRVFYIKCYFCVRGLRSWIGFSRIRGEWQNLLFFKKVNIPTANVVAYGETYCLGRSFQGAVITEELPNTCDLSDLFDQKHEFLQNRHWLTQIVTQLAKATRTMHLNRFFHNDLKLRNVLVTMDPEKPQIYLIDCPSGIKWPRPLPASRFVKDLACLNKKGKECLSKTMRMRFYRLYRQTDRLTNKDKQIIRKIIHYFRGRH